MDGTLYIQISFVVFWVDVDQSVWIQQKPKYGFRLDLLYMRMNLVCSSKTCLANFQSALPAFLSNTHRFQCLESRDHKSMLKKQFFPLNTLKNHLSTMNHTIERPAMDNANWITLKFLVGSRLHFVWIIPIRFTFFNSMTFLPEHPQLGFLFRTDNISFFDFGFLMTSCTFVRSMS
jgi:hypothetical protein